MVPTLTRMRVRVGMFVMCDKLKYEHIKVPRVGIHQPCILLGTLEQ